MRLQVFSTPEQASIFLGDYIASQINNFKPTSDKPNYILGLPTGSSPEGAYKRLIQLYRQKKLSFKNVITFNMDEYVGIEESNEQSYHFFMYDRLFNHIDIPRKNINILNGNAEDLEKECNEYESRIANCGGIDLFLGGMGIEGHLAFNESGSDNTTRTRKIKLAESTIQANCRFFGNDLKKVPKYALSVGISTILDNSKEVVLIVLGKNKQFALEKTIRNEVGPEYPSTYLRIHKNSMIVTDYDAIYI